MMNVITFAKINLYFFKITGLKSYTKSTAALIRKAERKRNWFQIFLNRSNTFNRSWITETTDRSIKLTPYSRCFSKEKITKLRFVFFPRFSDSTPIVRVSFQRTTRVTSNNRFVSNRTGRNVAVKAVPRVLFLPLTPADRSVTRAWLQ